MRPAIIAGLLLFVFLAFPSIFSQYYIDAWTQVAIYSIVDARARGCSSGASAWCRSARARCWRWAPGWPPACCSPTALPYPVVLLAAGLITMILGTLVGLPALRMSGLYLALITLMLAGAITVALATINFPNGGSGFTGYNGASVHIPPIRRPERSPRRIRRSSATRWSSRS